MELKERIILKKWYSYLWIIVIGFLLYLQTLFFNFTYLDDNVLILDNQIFLKNLSNILVAFKQDIFYILHRPAIYYRPILTISFILDTQWGGVKPFAYHFSNVVIHLVASVLVCLFLCRLGYKYILSLIFALIFTVHPILVPAIAWIPGRNDSLLTVFILTSFIFLIDFMEKNRWYKLFLHFLFFGLAIFTKESALVLILLEIMYFVLIRRRKIPLFNIIIIVIAWLLILITWFFLRKAALLIPIPLTFSDILKSMFINLPIIVICIGKLFFPFNLSVLPITQDSTKVYGIIAIIGVVTFLYFAKEKRYNFIIFGLTWFLLFLLPTFVRPNTEMLAEFIEHRVYLSIVGFIILILEFTPVKKLNIQGRTILIAATLIFLSPITFVYCKNFKNRLTFWGNAVENSPHSPLAHRNLGAMYYLEGFLDKAEAEYRKSLELNQQEEMVHNNLGLIYMARKMFPEAEEEYKKELKINPFYDNAHFNLGLLYYKQGRFREAEELWKETLEINPDYLAAYYNLIIYYHQQNNQGQVRYYIEQLEKKGVKINPELLRTLNIN